ncbi:MAG: AbrB/MazE/SpoVT family DNA-binding domain-containing protein [Leucobacter sp.]
MSMQTLGREAATITSKGQVTVPKRIRDALRLDPGSKVWFVPLHNGHVELVPRTATVDDLDGFLYDPDRKPLTIEEMEEAAADGWAFGDPDAADEPGTPDSSEPSARGRS